MIFPLLAEGLLEHAQQWISTGGYAMLFGLLFACGLGLPLPEDIPLLVAGALIAKMQMIWPIAAVCAWCGIIGGDCVLYHLGRKYGREITKVPYIGKHISLDRIEKAEKLFAKYGTWVVAIGRLFAGIRGAMVVTAGVSRFNFIKFLIVDGIAALFSGGMFMLLGYWFGNNMDWLMEKVNHYKHVVTIIAIPLIVLVIGYFWWRANRRKASSEVIPNQRGVS